MAYDSMYGSLVDAQSYFDTRLNADAWLESTQDEQKKALISATRRIDRLNFNGDKTSSDQTLEFPRGGDQTVPQDIAVACYEIALALLEGADPEMEFSSLTSTSFGFGPVKLGREIASIPDYVRSGIPSALAWSYIRPYLRDSRSIRISKV